MFFSVHLSYLPPPLSLAQPQPRKDCLKINHFPFLPGSRRRREKERGRFETCLSTPLLLTGRIGMRPIRFRRKYYSISLFSWRPRKKPSSKKRGAGKESLGKWGRKVFSSIKFNPSATRQRRQERCNRSEVAWGKQNFFLFRFCIREKGIFFQRAPLHPRMAVHSTHNTHETAKRLFLLPPPSYGEKRWNGVCIIATTTTTTTGTDRPTDDRAKIPFPE